MPIGKLCDGFKNEIQSRKECRLASKAIGLAFNPVDDTPLGFPRCSYNTNLKEVKYSKKPSRIRVINDIPELLRTSRMAICMTGNKQQKLVNLSRVSSREERGRRIFLSKSNFILL